MGFRRLGVYATAAGIVAIVFGVGLAACEIAFRLLDGYGLRSLQLGAAPTVITPEHEAKLHQRSVPLAAGMKAEWFDLSPPPLPRRPVDPALVAAATAYTEAGIGSEAIHVFNARFASERICSDAFYQRLPGFLFLYDPPNGAEYPRYRFPPNASLTSGLATNQFGWRGPQVELRKPPNTIRIAFVGASTTVNPHQFPFSYPELAGFWLNKWAEATLGIHVEAINAGREGIASPDIAAVVRDEVVPLEPDLVVYYEGGNQFAPGSVVRFKDQPGPPPPRPALQPTRTTALETYSALARRVAELARMQNAGVEPSKPAYEIVWPATVDENDPPLDATALPSNLSSIIADLDEIKKTLAASGGELALSSYVWMVFDGMKLDPVRHAFQWEYLNSIWYPYRYREMERLAAFQNRVFKKYAASRGIPFLDVAATMPRDPDLFSDAVHANYEGVRLHAWIVAQQLAPIVRDRVLRGRLPRPFQSDLAQHPAFPGNVRTAVFDCKSDLDNAIKLGRLDLSDEVQAVAPAIVEMGEELTVRIPKHTPPRYAALITLPSYPSPPPSSLGANLRFTAEIKISGGEAAVGILSSDASRFLKFQSLRPTQGFEPVTLAIDAAEKPGPLVVVGGKPSAEDITIELRAAELWQTVGPTRTLRTYAAGLAVPQGR